MMKTALAAATIILLAAPAAADDDDDDGGGAFPGGPIEVGVDCDRSDTITAALAAGDRDLPLIITIRGTCVENVTITRDDVTLRGIDPSVSTIIGAADPGLDENPISILGAERTIIERLTVTGGQNVAGIGGTTGFFTVRDCIVEENIRFGILVGQGAHGRIDNTVIRRNGEGGVIAFGGGFARIWNSEIRDNEQNGVSLVSNASAAIGLTPNNGPPGPNIIESNGRNGILVTGGSHARIDLNTIESNMQNGINVSNGSAAAVEGNSLLSNGQSGINVFGGSSATVADNNIVGNATRGIQFAGGSYGSMDRNEVSASGLQGLGVFSGSSVDMQDNTITGNNGVGEQFAGGISTFSSDLRLNGGNEIRENNGTGIRIVHGSLAMNDDTGVDVIELNSDIGIFAHRQSTLTINAGEIRQNGFGGIDLRDQSYMEIRKTTVANNADFGIRLERDAGVRFRDPPATVSGHAFFDLECLDLESSVVGTFDGVGVIDPACTGF